MRAESQMDVRIATSTVIKRVIPMEDDPFRFEEDYRALVEVSRRVVSGA